MLYRRADPNRKLEHYRLKGGEWVAFPEKDFIHVFNGLPLRVHVMVSGTNSWYQGASGSWPKKVIKMGRAIGKSTTIDETLNWKGSRNNRVYKMLTITNYHDFNAPLGTMVRYYLRIPLEQALTGNDVAIRKFACLYQKLTEKPCSNNPSSG